MINMMKEINPTIKNTNIMSLNSEHFRLLKSNVPSPVKLDIELSTYCNLRCRICTKGKHGYEKAYENNRHLTVNEFINILNGVDLNQLQILNFSGLNSEPLINPDILEILLVCIQLKNQFNINLSFLTNGMFLTQDINYLLLKCATEIHISFGGSNKKTFEHIRTGSNFDTVCINIKNLRDLKKKYNLQYPHIWLNPTLMKRCINEMPELILLAKEVGCQGVATSHLVVHGPEWLDESLFFDKDKANDILKLTKEVAAKENIIFTCPPYFDNSFFEKIRKDDLLQGWKQCRWLWNMAILGMDGVMACCDIQVGSGDETGDLSKHRLINIWNNDWYADMRHRLLSGNPPKECIRCKDSATKNINQPTAHFMDAALSAAIEYANSFPDVLKQIQFELECYDE